MLSTDSKEFKKVVHSLYLENRNLIKEEQEKVFEAVNADRKITKDLIREIALK